MREKLFKSEIQIIRIIRRGDFSKERLYCRYELENEKNIWENLHN